MLKKKGTKRKYRYNLNKTHTKLKLNTRNFHGGAGSSRSIRSNNPYEFCGKLDDAPFIYHASDYYSSGITPDIVNVVKTQYNRLINKTVIESLSKFGSDQYESESDNATTYVRTFLNIPICWQEIIILLYLSLKLHRLVENNSRVVSLGESPSKLVFIEEVLVTHPAYKNILEKHGFATDIEYTFFPISGLSTDMDRVDHDMFDLDLDLSSCIHNVESSLRQVDLPILEHFALFKLDPRSIVMGEKNIYIQDRCESYRSTFKLMSYYNKMCDMQKLLPDERLQLFERLYIIGFDAKDQHAVEKDRLIVQRLNIFFYQIITKQRTELTPDKYHFIQQNYPVFKNNIENIRSNDFNIFMNQHSLFEKVLTFLTTPENTLNDSRCVRSCSVSVKDHDCFTEVKKTYDTDGQLHEKQPGTTGNNCNLINLCLMLFINELGDDYIEIFIVNLDKIDSEILFYLNDHTFDTLNDEILEFVNHQTYNSNLLNNILNTKSAIHEINAKIDQFLNRDGLFSPCRYTPFVLQGKRKGKSHSRKSNGKSHSRKSKNKKNGH
jgi:hypothetical protein